MSKKRNRKLVNQLTTLNRVPEWESNWWFSDTYQYIHSSVKTMDFRLLTQKAHISVRPLAGVLATYDYDDNRIIFNPCLMNSEHKLVNAIPQILSHQLMRWSSKGSNVDKDYDRDLNKYYYCDANFYPSSLKSIEMEYACEKYMCEYGAKILCSKLYQHWYYGDKLLSLFDNYIKDRYTNPIVNQATAEQCLTSLRGLASMIAIDLSIIGGFDDYVKDDTVKVS